jgi:hypothetical protein
MALIEATEQFFGEADTAMRTLTEDAERWAADLRDLYFTACGRQLVSDVSANNFLITALKAEIDASAANISKIEEFVAANPSICDWISAKAPDHFLFRQPTILLVYFLANTRRISLPRAWPYTPAELVPVFADLGISLGE